MRLAGCNDVLNVGLLRRSEAGTRVWPVHRAKLPDDVPLDGLGVGVVALAVIDRAAVFRRHGEPVPGLGGRGADEREDGEQQ